MGTGPNGVMSAPSLAVVVSALGLAVTPRPKTAAGRALVRPLQDPATLNSVQVRNGGFLSDILSKHMRTQSRCSIFVLSILEKRCESSLFAFPPLNGAPLVAFVPVRCSFMPRDYAFGALIVSTYLFHMCMTYS